MDDAGRSVGEADPPADLKAEDAPILEVIGHRIDLLVEIGTDLSSEIIVHPIEAEVEVEVEAEVANVGQDVIVATETIVLLMEIAKILAVKIQQNDLLGNF